MTYLNCLIIYISEQFLSLFYLTMFVLYTGYIREGFLAVQHALDKAIMLYHESNASRNMFDSTSIFIRRFPHPAYSHDELIFIISSFLPLMFILMFSPTVLSIMRYIVWEREKRLKVIQLFSFFVQVII